MVGACMHGNCWLGGLDVTYESSRNVVNFEDQWNQHTSEKPGLYKKRDELQSYNAGEPPVFRSLRTSEQVTSRRKVAGRKRDGTIARNVCMDVVIAWTQIALNWLVVWRLVWYGSTFWQLLVFEPDFYSRMWGLVTILFIAPMTPLEMTGWDYVERRDQMWRNHGGGTALEQVQHAACWGRVQKWQMKNSPCHSPSWMNSRNHR